MIWSYWHCHFSKLLICFSRCIHAVLAGSAGQASIWGSPSGHVSQHPAVGVGIQCPGDVVCGCRHSSICAASMFMTGNFHKYQALARVPVCDWKSCITDLSILKVLHVFLTVWALNIHVEVCAFTLHLPRCHSRRWMMPGCGTRSWVVALRSMLPTCMSISASKRRCNGIHEVTWKTQVEPRCLYRKVDVWTSLRMAEIAVIKRLVARICVPQHDSVRNTICQALRLRPRYLNDCLHQDQNLRLGNSMQCLVTLHQMATQTCRLGRCSRMSTLESRKLNQSQVIVFPPLSVRLAFLANEITNKTRDAKHLTRIFTRMHDGHMKQAPETTWPEHPRG